MAATSGLCSRSAWLLLQVASPSAIRSCAHLDAAGSRVGLAIFAPPHREPVVEDPTGVQRLVGVVEHRERRDRGEVRRPRGRDEELRQPRVRDADHADRAVGDPGLRGDGLDHVVAVERLERFEVVERPARASGAAQVHADRRVAEDLGDARRGLAAVGVRRVVARVLDDGGVRAVLDRPGQGDVRRQQGAVPGLDVAEAGTELLRGVDRRIGGVGGAGDGDLVAACVADLDAVAGARLHVTEQRGALTVDAPFVDAPAARHEPGGGALLGAGHRHLLHASLHAEGSFSGCPGARAGGRDGAGEHESNRRDQQDCSTRHPWDGTKRRDRGTIGS